MLHLIGKMALPDCAFIANKTFTFDFAKCKIPKQITMFDGNGNETNKNLIENEKKNLTWKKCGIEFVSNKTSNTELLERTIT